jgi:hypothetical protein
LKDEVIKKINLKKKTRQKNSNKKRGKFFIGKKIKNDEIVKKKPISKTIF